MSVIVDYMLIIFHIYITHLLMCVLKCPWISLPPIANVCIFWIRQNPWPFGNR